MMNVFLLLLAAASLAKTKGFSLPKATLKKLDRSKGGFFSDLSVGRGGCARSLGTSAADRDSSKASVMSELLRSNSKADITAAVVFAMIGTLSAVVVPLFFSRVFAALTAPTFIIMDALRPVSFMALCHIIEPIFTILYIKKCASIVDKLVTSVRGDVFRGILSKDVASFDDAGASDAVQTVVADVDRLKNTFMNNISRDRGLRAMMEILTGFGILLSLHRPLAMLFLCVVPVTAYASSRFAKGFFGTARVESATAAKQSRYVEEVMTNFKEVFSFSNQALEQRRFETILRGNSETIGLVGSAKALFEASNRAGIYMNILSLFTVGGWMVNRKLVKPNVLVSFIGYCWSLNFATQGLLFSYGDWKMLSTSWQRIGRVLLPAALASSKAPAAAAAAAVMAVEWRNVSFSYPNRPDVAVLRDVSLSIPPGKVTALVGPSGAGKSTIASLLSRYYRASGGTITVDGLDAATLSDDEYLRRVSIVRQSALLFTDSVFNNIAYGASSYRDITHEEVVVAATAANAHEFIMRLPEGYATIVGDGAGLVQLSGGQRQRIAIARAIIKDASLLVLDESTSALDSESEALVQQSLERLMKGRTTVVIAHRLSTVINADQICVVREGCIAETGQHDELMRRGGYYSSLMSTQMAGFQRNPDIIG